MYRDIARQLPFLLYILISWILSFVFDRILLAPFHLASDDFAGTIMGMFMGMQVEYQFMAGVGIMIVKSLLLLQPVLLRKQIYPGS